jgi:hypothetical protein
VPFRGRQAKFPSPLEQGEDASGVRLADVWRRAGQPVGVRALQEDEARSGRQRLGRNAGIRRCQDACHRGDRRESREASCRAVVALGCQRPSTTAAARRASCSAPSLLGCSGGRPLALFRPGLASQDRLSDMVSALIANCRDPERVALDLVGIRIVEELLGAARCAFLMQELQFI